MDKQSLTQDAGRLVLPAIVVALSLFLVVASAALLVTGLANASHRLIWASIVASLLAALCLAVSVLQRRRSATEVEAVDAEEEPSGRHHARGDEQPTGIGALRGTAAGDQAAAGPPAGPDQPYPDPPDEPPVEDVSGPDALRVAGLDAERQRVAVVDGRPRYHLPDCPHLVGKDGVPLSLAEAREAGFTPCSLCKPDTTLAETARRRAGD